MFVAVSFDEEKRDIDIIDIDESIYENIDEYLNKFFNWMFDKKNKHRYWRKTNSGMMYCNYRASAFIEWLRDYGFDENAILVKEGADSTYGYPMIEF